MQDFYMIALALKIIKIFTYFFFQLMFGRRALRKSSQGEPFTLEICTVGFFFLMMWGSLLEVFWLNYNEMFYDTTGAYYIYFLGFIALAFLSVGIERSAELKTKGFVALVPLTMAVLTLVIGIQMIQIPYYFIALVVAVIPGLFLYQALVTEGLIRQQFLFIGVGYFLVFAGEALNYKIMELNFPWMLGIYGIEMLPPLMILLGLLSLFIGYVIIARKLRF